MYSGGGEWDQGVKHVSVFPCERHRLGVCDYVHKKLVKASLRLAQRPLKFCNESFAYAVQWHRDYI